MTMKSLVRLVSEVISAGGRFTGLSSPSTFLNSQDPDVVSQKPTLQPKLSVIPEQALGIALPAVQTPF